MTITSLEVEILRAINQSDESNGERTGLSGMYGCKRSF